MPDGRGVAAILRIFAGFEAFAGRSPARAARRILPQPWLGGLPRQGEEYAGTLPRLGGGAVLRIAGVRHGGPLAGQGVRPHPGDAMTGPAAVPSRRRPDVSLPQEPRMPDAFEFDDSLAYREIRDVGFNGLVGPIRFATVAEDEWRFYLDLDRRHSNVGGVCHGGALATLVDVGMGAAAFRAVGHRPVATIELNIQFVAAAKPGNRVHGRSRLVRAVKNIVFMSCEARSDGRLVVNGTGVWKVLDKTSYRSARDRGPTA